MLFLLKNNSPPDAKDKKGKTAAHYAVKGPNPDTLRLLAQFKADLSQRDKENMEPLLIAIQNKNRKMITALLEKKVKVNFAFKGISYLMMAVEQKDLPLFKKLLDLGADTTLKNYDGLNVEKMCKKKELTDFLEALENANSTKKSA